MTKQKQHTHELSKKERSTLITCTTIIVVFFLFVAIATRVSLSYYTIPHLIVGLITTGTLLFANTIPKTLARIIVGVALIGAVSAIGLTLAYLPYYSQYLNYMNNIK
jgi:4-amino-4-deoxy-L-arabinose transferase-like glycosyltransferase